MKLLNCHFLLGVYCELFDSIHGQVHAACNTLFHILSFELFELDKLESPIKLTETAINCSVLFGSVECGHLIQATYWLQTGHLGYNCWQG
jgi:hypothetical protein